MRLTAVRGTRDLLPDDLVAWRRVESVAREVFERFGYREIRTPLFEMTELFVRGVGETTDIVDKEMYTFQDRGGRSVALRPEGTASVVRACIEHSLIQSGAVRKLHYVGPMYRYERPQAGRYREFWQAGIEAFGVADAPIDAEVLVCAYEFLAELGLKDLVVQLNSIGDEERPAYVQQLRQYVEPRIEQFCGQCQGRLDKNPLRLLDCKVESCGELLADAPKILDSLSEESATHFDAVRRLLDRAGVPYVVNPYIVRGLDYYTRTAFEITAEGLGSQDAVLAGGRYDRLVEDVGGPSVPGIGFAAGIDRLLLAMEAQDVGVEAPPALDVYVVTIGDGLGEKAFEILTDLRRAGVAADMDYQSRSLRAQMKTANRLAVPYAVLLGEDEIAQDAATVRDMQDGSQETLPLADLPVRLAACINPRPES